MKSRWLIALLLILLFVAAGLLVRSVMEQQETSAKLNLSLPSVNSGQNTRLKAELISATSNGVSAITSSNSSSANLSQSSASQTNSPAKNAASQVVVANVPSDLVQLPVTPASPPPAGLDRTDAPVIPPGRGRIFSGP
jgi:hypothetical protein